MDVQDIRVLKLLEEFDTKNSPSQRYLAKKLNISLGLVNSFLKRLAQKGYFKITTIPRNRVKYILTPKGALEKARLTYEYIQYSFKFYRDARHKIKQSLKDLEDSNIHDIVFYGMSDLAEITYVSLQETTMNLKAVVDDQEAGKWFLGHRIQSSDVLNSMAFDKILITAISTSGNPVDTLRKMNIKKEKIMLIQ
jgi:predicted transcriptional regulator